MADRTGVFWYGASYSPLIYPEAEWEADLARMQAASMNMIRLGDTHGAWDRIEPQSGQIRLELLERFYAQAARHGLSILLSTGVSSPPLWLARRHPDVSILSSRGEPYPLAASYHWACIHHPGLEAAARQYVAALARFAVRQPNHFGWQISNEIGFPFIPARDTNELSLYCYCPHCCERFCQWVQAKYGTLKALSEAWTWSTTAFWYNDWLDVEPPEAMPTAWSGVTRWIDWRLFWQAAFARFARWQHDLIREIDPAHPTCVNTFNFKSFDRFGTFTGLDQWQLADQVDHVGYDLYPGSGDKLRTRPEHTSMFLDHGRSVSASVGRDFWLPEIESGPIGGWVLGPDHNTSPADIWRNGLEAIGHGAKLVIYMPWKEWGYQPIHWGALVSLDGSASPRLAAAGELGAYLRANTDFLSRAKTPPGEIALLESKPNAIFFRGIEQEEILFAAQRGAYRAGWELGFGVDFLTPAQLMRGQAGGCRVIVLPLLGALNVETAEALRRFVFEGGLLVGCARCGTIDERGWYHRQLPIPGLREVFGIESVEADHRRDVPLTLNGQAFASHLNRDLVKPLSETEVLAKFADGWPAVTLARHGQGYGLYLATQADSAYVSASNPLLREALALGLARLGLEPGVRLDYAGRKVRELDPHLLHTPERTTILISNYLTEDTSAVLRLATRGRKASYVQAGWLEPQPLAFIESGSHLECSVELRKEHGEAIDIFWHPDS